MSTDTRICDLHDDVTVCDCWLCELIATEQAMGKCEFCTVLARYGATAGATTGEGTA